LLEDGKAQQIDYFAVQAQPISIGIIWGGGTASDPDVRDCPRAFVRNSVLGSEYFLMQNDTVTTSYTTDATRIPLIFAWSGSSSDSIFIGLDVLKESANPRKILLVVAEPGGGGGGQLQREYVERAAIRLGSSQVHVVSFWDGDVRTLNHEGSLFLNEMVELTGGSYYLGPVSRVICPNLAKELRVQYLIGYHPTNNAKDGKWRNLSVKVDSPTVGPKLSARIKRGYYAAKISR
jgi:Ca-activated chloride channel homolog